MRWSIATTDGSESTIPRPRTYTSVFAVPRSTAMSRPPKPVIERKMPMGTSSVPGGRLTAVSAPPARACGFLLRTALAERPRALVTISHKPRVPGRCARLEAALRAGASHLVTISHKRSGGRRCGALSVSKARRRRRGARRRSGSRRRCASTRRPPSPWIAYAPARPSHSPAARYASSCASSSGRKVTSGVDVLDALDARPEQAEARETLCVRPARARAASRGVGSPSAALP